MAPDSKSTSTSTPKTPTTSSSKPPSKAASLLTAARKASRDTKDKDTNHDFSQEDLLAFDICKDKPELVTAVNELTRSHDLILLEASTPSTPGSSSKPITYRLRPPQAATSLKSQPVEARQLYGIIESAGSNGIWTKTLTYRSKLPQLAVGKYLKGLESARLIKQMRNVKMPSRKMYLLQHLAPPTEATGGSWFSDGELDTELVEGLGQVALQYIEGKSWRVGAKMSEKALLEKRRTWDEAAWAPALLNKRVMLPYPASFRDYPTASEVLGFMEMHSLFQGKDVSVQDIQILLDMLEYDGRLEKMGRKREAMETGDPEADAESDNERPKKRRRANSEEEESENDEGSEDEDNNDQASEGSNSEVDVVKSTEPRARKRQKRDDTDEMGDSPEPKPQKMRKVPMYRSVRKPLGLDANIGPGSAFAETPCSRCPVFDLCADGGPINAKDCGYFPEWLNGRPGQVVKI